MKESICRNCGKNQIDSEFGYCSSCLKKINPLQEISSDEEKFFEINIEKNPNPNLLLANKEPKKSSNNNSEHFKRSRELIALLSRNTFFMNVRDNGQVLSILVKKKKLIFMNFLKLFGVSLIFVYFLNIITIKWFSLIYFFTSLLFFIEYAFYKKNLIIDTNKQKYSVFNHFSKIEGDCSELSVGIRKITMEEANTSFRFLGMVAKKNQRNEQYYFEVVLKQWGQKIFTFCKYNSIEQAHGTSATIAHILEIEYDKTINEIFQSDGF